jgi:ferric-dicitrate binding protein FerR (iron transport regulator)
MKKVFLFLYLSLSAGAFAADGIVDYIDGIVDLVIDGEVNEAFIGDDVPEGTTIITGDGATAIVALSGGTEIKLRGNTSITLDRNQEAVALQLKQGSVFAFVDPDEGRNFQVYTETTVAGVRGTEFFMSFGRLIDENPDVWLCVNEGVVDVGILGQDDVVAVEAGKGVTIPGGVKLTEPRFYEWTTELNWNTDPDAGSVTDTTSLDEAYADLLDQDYF